MGADSDEKKGDKVEITWPLERSIRELQNNKIIASYKLLRGTDNNRLYFRWAKDMTIFFSTNIRSHSQHIMHQNDQECLFAPFSQRKGTFYGSNGN